MRGMVSLHVRLGQKGGDLVAVVSDRGFMEPLEKVQHVFNEESEILFKNGILKFPDAVLKEEAEDGCGQVDKHNVHSHVCTLGSRHEVGNNCRL
jgi:hypothetical protein